MIPREEIAAVLDDFAKKVIQQARRNLTLDSSNKTRALHKSFERDIVQFKESINVFIVAQDYWRFINYGVKGIESGKSLKGYRFKNHITPFKKGAGVIPPISAFKTDKINRIVSDGQARASAINVWKFGIKSTEFFTRPFKTAFIKVSKEIEDVYGLVIEKELKKELKNDGNR